MEKHSQTDYECPTMKVCWYIVQEYVSNRNYTLIIGQESQIQALHLDLISFTNLSKDSFVISSISWSDIRAH